MVFCLVGSLSALKRITSPSAVFIRNGYFLFFTSGISGADIA
jgi:hypothetical protein